MNKFIIATLLSVASATDFSVAGGAVNFSVNFNKDAGTYTYKVKLESGKDLWLAFGDSYNTTPTQWLQFKASTRSPVVSTAYGTKGFPRAQQSRDYTTDIQLEGD